METKSTVNYPFTGFPTINLWTLLPLEKSWPYCPALLAASFYEKEKIAKNGFNCKLNKFDIYQCVGSYKQQLHPAKMVPAPAVEIELDLKRPLSSKKEYSTIEMLIRNQDIQTVSLVLAKRLQFLENRSSQASSCYMAQSCMGICPPFILVQ